MIRTWIASDIPLPAIPKLIGISNGKYWAYIGFQWYWPKFWNYSEDRGVWLWGIDFGFITILKMKSQSELEQAWGDE